MNRSASNAQSITSAPAAGRRLARRATSRRGTARSGRSKPARGREIVIARRRVASFRNTGAGDEGPLHQSLPLGRTGAGPTSSSLRPPSLERLRFRRRPSPQSHRELEQRTTEVAPALLEAPRCAAGTAAKPLAGIDGFRSDAHLARHKRRRTARGVRRLRLRAWRRALAVVATMRTRHGFAARAALSWPPPQRSARCAKS